VLPAGVETNTPSQIISSRRTTPSTWMRTLAAKRVFRLNDTSLMAIA
jgi:hypothetical protein